MKTRIHRFALIVMIVATVMSAAVQSRAKTITAASCKFTDVSNAVNQASPGDVVFLPPGTNSWSETLTLNGVSLIGAGTNLTVLKDEESRTGSGKPQMIILNAEAGIFSEIADIQFAPGVTNTSANYYGAIAANGVPGASWRIDHNVFNALYAKGIVTRGNCMRLIDHNAFYETEISVSDNGYFTSAADPNGDLSWASPPTYGVNSSNCLYMENNFITNVVGYVASVGACDGNTGSRIVFRYNTVWDDLFNNHGTESEGRPRSQRSFEIYENTFNCSPQCLDYPIYAAAMLRGGSGVMFSNTISNFGDLAALRTYRYMCSYLGQWEPFGGANGLSPYDSNSPTLYLTGTSAGPSSAPYLQVSGASWTVNQWVGYSVLDVNSGVFSIITSNSVNTIYYIGSTSSSASIVACTLLTFNPGDVFQIRRVYVALDQLGRGSGNLLEDISTNGPNQGYGANGNLVTINTVTGVPSWPNEVLEGVYAWGNTLNGAPANLDCLLPSLQAGRDYYNNTPMPGYTPFVYPHPLEYESYATNTIPPYTNNPVTNNPNTNNPVTNNPNTNNPASNNLAPPYNFHQIP